MNQQGTQDESVSLSAWDPARLLRTVDAREARYSRGFLRCKPEKWLPGFPTHWLPLAHSLGLECKALEVKPVLSLPGPRPMEHAFGGTVDGEAVGVYADADSARVLLNAVIPSSLPGGAQVVLEYLARRFLASLAMSWSGPESSVVQFDAQALPREGEIAGVVRFVVSINGEQCQIYLALGRALVERLDGLWRRQVQSTAKAGEGNNQLSIEIAQLAVPPTMLVEYLKTGTVIDLEVPVSDSVTLKLGGKPWQAARVCSADGSIGVETLPGPVSSPLLPEGTTRLSIQFGTLAVDPVIVAELAQPGAIYPTGLPLSDMVQLIINAERVGSATLCTYQGRYAITVL